jgi:Na+/H+ antiporter NhaA
MFVHASGVHATVAGVALAFIIPTHSRINAQEFSTQARSLLDEFDRTETGDFCGFNQQRTTGGIVCA